MDKKNIDRFEIDIKDISDQGQGIGRRDGTVVFVEGALPGDKVLAQVTQQKKNYLKAKTVKLINPSPNRVEPKCPYVKECGGCPLMEMSYGSQLQIKTQQLENKLKRIADIEGYSIQPIVGMDHPLFYRNKTEYSVDKSGNIGFNRQNTNKVVDIPKCYISHEVANVVRDVVKKNIIRMRVDIQKLTIRTSFSTGETMVIFQTRDKDGGKLIDLIMDIDDAVNNMSKPEGKVISSLESAYTYDPTKTKKAYKLVAGKPTILDEICGLKFEISPASFYQINPIQTNELFSKIKEYLTPEDDFNIFDLYCGVGSIGLTLAKYVKQITGIEIVKEAVLDANRNAVINGIINARYIHGKAEELMDDLNIDSNSTVILDPPRAGSKKAVLDTIGRTKPKKVIYISCDPGTFSRDAKILSESGYKLNKIAPLDMFPNTIHLEVVGLFELA